MVEIKNHIDYENDYWDDYYEYLLNLKLNRRLLNFYVLLNLTDSNYFKFCSPTNSFTTEGHTFYSFNDSLNNYWSLFCTF